MDYLNMLKSYFDYPLSGPSWQFKLGLYFLVNRVSTSNKLLRFTKLDNFKTTINIFKILTVTTYVNTIKYCAICWFGMFFYS